MYVDGFTSGFEVLSTTEETLFNSRNVSRLVQNNLNLDNKLNIRFDVSAVLVGWKTCRAMMLKSVASLWAANKSIFFAFALRI